MDPSSEEDLNVVELAYGPCSQIVNGVNCDEQIKFKDETAFESSLLLSEEKESLTETVLTLKRALGTKLDIEFSFDMQSRLVVHQVRQITTARTK